MTDLALSSPPRAVLAEPLPWVLLAAWFAVIAALTGTGFFLQPSEGLPLRILPFAFVPPLLFLLAHRWLPSVRAWVAALDLAMVVALQSFRVIGIVFLAYWVSGDLPAVFALPAGLGDLAVGLLAVSATLAVARRSPGWERRTKALIAWGLLDFAAAFSLALLANEGMPLHFPGAGEPALVLSLPLALIPAFAVPVFTILHAIAWIKLREPT